MSKSQKLKMSVGKFRAITIPIMSFSLVFALVLTIGTNYFTPSLDAFLGKGARTASRPTGTSGWDADYYAFESTNSEQALQRSIAVAEAIADEGIVLLKNDGTLPLTADTPVTPMGYRYASPLMSGSGSGGTDTTADYVYTAVKGITEAFHNVNTAAADAMDKGTLHESTPAAASGEGGQTAFLGS